MSLPMLAVGICAAQALRGATWAGNRVYFEPAEVLDDVMGDEKPVIAVFCAASVAAVDGKDILAPDAKVTLIIQIYLPAAVTLPAGERISTLGEGGAIVMGIVHRQIEAVLSGGQSPWAALWREFVFSIGEIEVNAYLMESQKGARVVTREITMTLDTLASPVIAGPLPDVWARLVSSLPAAEGLGPAAPLLVTALQAFGSLPGWRRAEASLGVYAGTAKGIGLAPVDATEDGEPALFSGADIDGLSPGLVTIRGEDP